MRSREAKIGIDALVFYEEIDVNTNFRITVHQTKTYKVDRDCK